MVLIMNKCQYCKKEVENKHWCSYECQNKDMWENHGCVCDNPSSQHGLTNNPGMRCWNSEMEKIRQKHMEAIFENMVVEGDKIIERIKENKKKFPQIYKE